jgi:hypothetical protein
MLSPRGGPCHQVDRVKVDDTVNELIGTFEKLGLSEGSRYPAISATILAIYREFV